MTGTQEEIVLTGPTGAQGIQGVTGPTGHSGTTPLSSNEEIVHASFLENEDTGVMRFDNTWFVPNPSEYFKLLDNQLGGTNVSATKPIFNITRSLNVIISCFTSPIPAEATYKLSA